MESAEAKLIAGMLAVIAEALIESSLESTQAIKNELHAKLISVRAEYDNFIRTTAK